ncbi:MAG TPA: PfkB family carbohydrate kinase, partial [Bacteroidota bacterium]
IQRHDILPPIVSSVVDPTGSGDVFGAAFSYRYFRDRDTLAAARFANEVAGISVEHIGPSGLQEVNRRYSAKQRLSSASA